MRKEKIRYPEQDARLRKQDQNNYLLWTGRQKNLAEHADRYSIENNTLTFGYINLIRHAVNYLRNGNMKQALLYFTLATLIITVCVKPGSVYAEEYEDSSASSSSKFTAEQSHSVFNNSTSIPIEKQIGLNVGTVQPDISILLSQRFFIENSLKSSPEEIEKCNQLEKRVINTPKVIPGGQQNLERVLEVKEFKIVCVTPQKMKIIFGKNVNGRFDSINNAIFLTNVEQTDERIVNHESYHADTYYRNRVYTENSQQALTPVFPYSRANIETYNKDFDRGDQRIREFAQLRQKQLQGETLNKRDLHLLKKYNEASAMCVRTSFIIEVSQENYQFLTTIDWASPSREPAFLVFGNTNEKVEIMGIRQNEGVKLAVVRPIEDAQVVIFLPDKIKSALGGEYADLPKEIQLAEREAYTFEALSASAITTFYREAYNRRQKFIKEASSAGKEAIIEHSKTLTL